MKVHRKRWSEMTTEELAAATREFDDPTYQPPARKPSRRRAEQLKRVQRKAAASRMRVAVMLQKDMVEFTGSYAVDHGITFSDVVATALQQFQKKSA